MPYNPGGQTGPPGPPGPTAIIQDEGIAIPGAPHTVLNFVGAGVVASNAGFGVATITIPGGGGPPIEPAAQIVFGTGAGIDSDPDFTYTNTGATNGQFFVNTITGTGVHPSVTSATPARVAIYGVENTDGTGGDVDLWGGYGTTGGSNGVGGDINLFAGEGGGAQSLGGDVNLFGGTGVNGAGDVNLTGGTGPSGNINIAGGSGAANNAGGFVDIVGGAGSGLGAPGAITIAGGVPIDANGASVSLAASAGVGTNRSGGDVSLTAGDRTGSGVAGAINLNFPATGELNLDASPGVAGQQITSQGPNLPPVWAASGASAQPATQIVFGTGASVTSDPDFTYTAAVNGDNGQFFVNTTTGVGAIGSATTTQATPARVAIYGVTGVQAANARGGRLDLWGGYATVGTGATIGGDVNIWGGNTGGGPTATGGNVNVFGGDAATAGGKVDIIGGAATTGGNVEIDGGVGTGSGGNTLIKGGVGNSGGVLDLEGGASSGTGSGGNINMTGGAAGTASGGSIVNITGGTAGGAALAGGSTRLKGGTGGATSGTGGQADLRGGDGTGTGDGGVCTVNGGGSGFGATGNAGDVNIFTGAANATLSNGGEITLTALPGVGGGTNGSIRFTTGGTERFEILGAGGWEIGGSEGTAGQPLTSNGAGTPPTWQAPAGVANDVAQATRTTIYTLTTGFVDITLDSTDVETDAAVIDHEAGTTDRFTIGATGTYRIDYNIDIDSPAAVNVNWRVNAQVRVNDTTVLTPSAAWQTVINDNSIELNLFYAHMSMSFVRNFTAADFVTLQLSATDIGATGTGIPDTRAGGITVTVTRLK